MADLDDPIHNPKDLLHEGEKCLMDGRLVEASTHLRHCLDFEPENPQARLMLAKVARLVGKPEDGLPFATSVASAQPSNPEALSELARILDSLDRHRKGVDSWKKVLKIRPDEPEAHLAIGRWHESLGQWQEARDHLDQCVILAPRNAEAWMLLGSCLHTLHKPGKALEALKRSVELDPTLVRGYMRLANLHRELSQTWLAVKASEAALHLRPRDPYILSNLGNAWLDLGQSEQAIEFYTRSLEILPDAPTTHSNMIFALQYRSEISRQEIAHAHREWGRKFGTGVPRVHSAKGVNPDNDLPMRVGFISADFRYHPVGRMAGVLWENLDPKRVVPIVYDNAPAESQMMQKAKEHVLQWRRIHRLSDEALEQQIQKDRIDILVDMAGHTSGNRLLVLARKPAPVQMTVFAYPNTTGLDTVDYRITDPIADPPGTEQLYVEKLLRLPRVAWIYGPPLENLGLAEAPCLSGKPFTFGCLNNPAKISSAAVETWSTILNQRRDTRLLMLVRDDPRHADLVRDRFTQHGVTPGQLIFTTRCPEQKYLEQHHRIDLMLDPFPYNGGVTTCDCLWMGTPILTLAGDSYVSRQGACILSSTGLSQWVANSKEEFIRKAISAAQNPSNLAVIREKLRSILQASPLMDHAQYAHDLETALLRARRKKTGQS